MKKILSSLLTAVIITAVLALPSSAADEPTIRLQSSQATPGANITVDITVQNNPGICAMKFVPVYDETVMTFDGITVNAGFGGTALYEKAFVWINSSGNSQSNGVIATMNFTVLNKLGDYDVSVEYEDGDICNRSEDSVNFTVSAAKISVTDRKVGDINGDNVVNAKDLTRLMKLISGEQLVAYGADVNGDGKTNALDLTRLMKLIAGGTGETNPSSVETEPVVQTDTAESEETNSETEAKPETAGETAMETSGAELETSTETNPETSEETIAETDRIPSDRLPDDDLTE